MKAKVYRVKDRWGLPRWLSGEESTCQSTCQCRRHEFDPWSGTVPHAPHGTPQGTWVSGLCACLCAHCLYCTVKTQGTAAPSFCWYELSLQHNLLSVTFGSHTHIQTPFENSQRYLGCWQRCLADLSSPLMMNKIKPWSPLLFDIQLHPGREPWWSLIMRPPRLHLSVKDLWKVGC